MKKEVGENQPLNKNITLLDVCDVVFGFNIPGFNRHNDDFLRAQAELVIKVANDPEYILCVEEVKKAVVNQNMIDLEKGFLKKEEYVHRKFEREKMYHKGTEQAAFCTLNIVHRQH